MTSPQQTHHEIRSPFLNVAGITALAAVLAAAVLMATAGAASAEVTKFFNKTLSLSGDCSTTSYDDVPDPGCPTVAHPPEGPLAEATGVSTDSHGNIYVVNRNRSEGNFAFHIDIFNANGEYRANLPVSEARSIAVDSTGHIYVYAASGAASILRYDPTLYEPIAGEFAYDPTPVVFGDIYTYGSMYVDTTNDHLYVSVGAGAPIREYAAPVDGVPNELLEDNIAPEIPFTGQVVVDSNRNRIYVVNAEDLTASSTVEVYDQEAPYAHITTITGEDGPFSGPKISLAIDETTGHLIVGDIAERKRVYEFDNQGTYIGTLKRPPNYESDFVWITVDNWEDSPNRGFLFIPTGFGNNGHLLAYEPEFAPVPPVVESLTVGGVTEDEAVLNAVINPKGAVTPWTFEYVTQESFENEGFAAAVVDGEGVISPGNEGVAVSSAIAGLTPGTVYRIQVRAEHCLPEGCSETLRQATFTTYSQDLQQGACANDAFRVGFSAVLPDCRAYELVTPPNTGGAPPTAPASATSGMKFGTPPAAPNGESLSFVMFGTLIPGMDGTGGGLSGDPYRSIRTPQGWGTELIGPNGTQAATAAAGGLSADHGYVAITAGVGTAGQQGSLVLNESSTNYLRYPDGSFWLASGTLGSDPNAEFEYVAPGGTHVIFRSAGGTPPRLEPKAALDGTNTIYDRTPDGVTHVVSLLPGEVTPSSGQDAAFLGASDDGSSVAFTIGNEGPPGPMYLRVENTETLVAGPPSAAFAGLSADGRYLFYVDEGDVYRFDSEAPSATRLTEVGDAELVNIAPSGEAGYFISNSFIPGANPRGAEPQSGGHNLYHWGADGSIDFVATVTKRDAEGASGPASDYGGLALWLPAVKNDAPGILASRTTNDGSTLLFESREDLTSFKSQGNAQVYRYSAAGSLDCLSCNRVGTAPTSDTVLLAYKGINPDPLSLNTEPSGMNQFVEMANLSSDGNRAFFETKERLLVSDNDNVADVYEWEANGKGSCAKPGGCLFMISSGQSTRANHLFGASASGNDVFILTADLLVPQDTDETPSVYDARVGGGFPPPVERAGECLGEACQPAAVPLNDPTPNSASYRGEGNVVPAGPRRRCGKGKRLVRKAGKARCVRKKHHKKKQSNADRRAHR